MTAFASLLAFPFWLHPPMGSVVTALEEGRRVKALFIATFSGFLYDLTINHLPFGVYTLCWIVAVLLTEGLRSFLFLNRVTEIFLLTLFFAAVIQIGEAFATGIPQLFYDKLLLEAMLAPLLFHFFPQLTQRWKLRRSLA